VLHVLCFEPGFEFTATLLFNTLPSAARWLR
jgi:hypothetical protein